MSACDVCGVEVIFPFSGTLSKCRHVIRLESGETRRSWQPKAMRTGLDDGPPNSIVQGDYQPSNNTDLLAAAKAALELIGSTLAHVSHGGPTRAEAEVVFAQLQAAIGKAEG